MADAAIIDQIRSFLTPMFEKQTCILKFAYNERLYITKFTASHTADKIQLKNDCVDVLYKLDDERWKGEIMADSEERACFDPILKTNARNKVGKRTTSVDVLQILKTKLCLACPVVPPPPITLLDRAGTGTMEISPFHLLRGGDAFYEKYGYGSSDVNELKEGLRTFTWSECTPKIVAVIQELTKEKTFSPETRLINIAKDISWDEESAANEERGSAWSADILEAYGKEFFPEMSWKYTLNQEDPRWIAAKTSMVFTDFTVVATGGSRTRRKQRRSRRRRH